jgi:hypothetical protein
VQACVVFFDEVDNTASLNLTAFLHFIPTSFAFVRAGLCGVL